MGTTEAHGWGCGTSPGTLPQSCPHTGCFSIVPVPQHPETVETTPAQLMLASSSASTLT